ncbi:MAG: ribosomal protein S18 acetylase RimI-like enzyme, partial [Myxococcota bacterium]
MPPIDGPVRVTRLHPGEGPRLRALRLRALVDAPDAFGSTAEETATRPPESWRQQLTDLATFVVVVGGEDVGMVRSVLADGSAEDAYLLSMWVAPSARGRGAGDALIAAVIGWSRSVSARRVLLDVADDNAPAIALYARHGFVPTGVVGTLLPPR